MMVVVVVVIATAMTANIQVHWANTPIPIWVWSGNKQLANGDNHHWMGIEKHNETLGNLMLAYVWQMLVDVLLVDRAH